MTENNYRKLTGYVFVLIALAHLCRVLTSTPIAVGTKFIPNWTSWIGVLIAAYLAYQGLRRR
ncbi:hypothetical protein KW800_00400 [Candidatus Parcubacteria bacterium]|nr:hypothetical protein [Candidatus Parcubacteria bacterium]